MNSTHDSSGDWMVLIGILILVLFVFGIFYKILAFTWKAIKLRNASHKRAVVLDMSNVLPLKKMIRH